MLGIKSRHKESGGVGGGNGAGGRQVWLHELVEAITTALIAATRPIQRQHIAAMGGTFQATGPQASDGAQRDAAPESGGSSQQASSPPPAETAVPGFPGFLGFPGFSGPGLPGLPDSLVRPETLVIGLPATGAVTDADTPGHDQPPLDEVVVPAAALIQSNALVIDEATIELECTFDRFDTQADERQSRAHRLGVRLDKTGSGSPARIVMKFKRVDRPEGASRIEDALLRNIQ
jgi:hypothetical protein